MPSPCLIRNQRREPGHTKSAVDADIVNAVNKVRLGSGNRLTATPGFTPSKVFEKLRDISPVPVYHEDLPAHYGGFYYYNDKDVPNSIIMNAAYKASPEHDFVLAHEIGHAQYGETPVGKLLQGKLHQHAWSNKPGWASFLSGALMPTRATRAAGVLGSTAFASIYPFNELAANRYARKALRAAGATDQYWAATDKDRKDNYAVAAETPAATFLAGLLGLGAREVYDHRQQILDMFE